MKILTSKLGYKNDDILFDEIIKTFREKITTYSWFVNWKKVKSNVKDLELSLNIMNYLIGKPDFVNELTLLILKHPEIVKSFPTLIATRENDFDILINIEDLISKRFNFTKQSYSHEEATDLACFLRECGLAELIVNKNIKNFVDYVYGVEVGLDSNGRKNRSGTMMENICEVVIKKFCEQKKYSYIPQATKNKIFEKWNINIEMDKSDRIIDFALKGSKKIYLIEVNFYGGGGSKLKSTATEYCEMYNRYHSQNVDFIWITDGAGWSSSLKPLREYFDKSDYLINIAMLKDNVLNKIIE